MSPHSTAPHSLETRLEDGKLCTGCGETKSLDAFGDASGTNRLARISLER